MVLLSATEGDDKPGKYPKAFRSSNVVVITKTDLLPYVPFSVENAIQDALAIQPQLKFFNVCALNDEGIAAWCASLVAARHELLAKSPSP